MQKDYYKIIDQQLLSDINESEYSNLEGHYYLHLHEDDIILFDSSYRLSSHIVNFINSLPYYFSSFFSFDLAIENMCCCYSYESENSLSYELCEKSKYYYYELGNIVSVKPSDLKRSNIIDIDDKTSSLADILKKYQVIQPYILHDNQGNLDVVFEPFKVEGNEDYITNLITNFKTYGGYQFSIYGFNFKEGFEQIWLEDRSMLYMLKIAFIRHIISWNYELKQAHKSKFSTEQFARKSAISNVMARGLSHAMGSHILPEYRNYYNSLLGRFLPKLEDRTPIEDFLKKQFENWEFNNWQILEKRFFLNNTQNHLNHFFNYTQQRMELIADVTMVENGRSAFDYKINKNLFQDFESYSKSILLGLIDSFENHTDPKVIELKTNLTNESEMAFIPGGQLGKSALFMILEGIIRNYYKHALEGRSQKKYNFLFNVSEPNDERLQQYYHCIDFVDCHGVQNKKQRDSTLINNLQHFIDGEIITKQNQLRSEGWGFIEMKASCAYLINYPLEFIEDRDSQKINRFNPDAKYPIKLLEVGYYKISKDGCEIEAGPSKKPNNGCDLGFRFYIKKPKNILIDSSFLDDKIKALKKVLEAKGIFFTDSDKFLRKRTEHEILVTNKEVFTNQRVLSDVLFDSSKSIEDQVWNDYALKLSSQSYKIYSNGETFDSMNIFDSYWDNHGKQFKEYDLNTIKSMVKSSYYHYSSKINFIFIEFLSSIRANTMSIKLNTKIKEMLLTKISIFDERIQKGVQHANGDQPLLSMRDTWELSNVYIPPINADVVGSEMTAFDLDASNQSNLTKAIKDRLTKGDDYIIIHYTLFEKLVPKGDKAENFYNNLESHFGTSDIKNRIVFSSGIRNPSSIAKDCLFINLSTLTETVVIKPCKFTLVNILKFL